MPWLWATAEECMPTALAPAIPDDHIAFFNGGTEPDLWGRTYRGGHGADRSAAAEFLATAHACVAALDPMSGRAVTVLGEGLLAQLIRDLLPHAAPGGPRMVIDTTGSPDRIKQAIGTLDRHGYLYIVAPPRVDEIDLATYRDIHVQALTIAGVSWVSDPTDGVASDTNIDAALGRLVHVFRGTPMQDGAWYAVHDRPLG